MKRYLESEEHLTRDLFSDSYQLIIGVTDIGEIFITTLKCGQTYIRQFSKVCHFQVETRAKGTDQHLVPNCYNDMFNFIPFDEIGISHKELFELIGVDSIQQIFEKKLNIVIRHPFDRFVSGVSEVAISLIGDSFGGSDLHELSQESTQKLVYNNLKLQTKADPDVILQNIHLNPWLGLVNNIMTDNSNIVILENLTEFTKNYKKLTKESQNSKKFIYKDFDMGSASNPYRILLEKYRHILINEYQLWKKLTSGREENS